MVAIGNDAARETGALGREVPPQGRRPRRVDPRQGRDASKPGLQAVSSQRTQGSEKKARGV